MLGSDGEPDLDGPRLVRLWSQRTVTDQRTVSGPSDRDLQPVFGHIGLGRRHRGHELSRLLQWVRRIPPLAWCRATAGSDLYLAKASTSDSRKRRRNSLGVRSCVNASSVIPPVSLAFVRECQVPGLKEASNSR